MTCLIIWPNFVIIALSVAKKYAKTLSADLSLKCSEKGVLGYKWEAIDPWNKVIR